MISGLDAFIAPARERAALWRLFVGVALIAVLVVLAMSALYPVFIELCGAPGDPLYEQRNTLFSLATFIPWWLALIIALRLLHRRGIGTVLGPARPGRARRFGVGIGIAMIFAAVAYMLSSPFRGPPEPSALSFGQWAQALLPGAALILIQTGAEETIFRGYILQQLAARFRSPLVWAVLPSALFGLLHWSPDAPANTIAVMVNTGFIGCVMAMMTARTGDLYTAWGLHFGNNISALLLIAPQGYLSGLALYYWPDDVEALTRLIWLDTALMAIFALVALRFIPSRRDG
ncbi:MAG: lysostaphin resistance A-like protein [Pikeienuella sp.]